MPQKRTVPRICEVCSVAFLAQPRDIDRGRGKFCSRYCAGAAGAKVVHARHPQQGEGNFNFQGWKSLDNSHYVLKSIRKYPGRHRARLQLRYAIDRGDIQRPAACSQCGDVALVHGHHHNYRYPLRVQWLCRPCHLALHDHRRRVRAALLAT